MKKTRGALQCKREERKLEGDDFEDVMDGDRPPCDQRWEKWIELYDEIFRLNLEV